MAISPGQPLVLHQGSIRSGNLDDRFPDTSALSTRIGMNVLVVLRLVGFIAATLGLSLLLPALVGFGYGESDWRVFVVLAVALCALAAILLWVSRRAADIQERDGFLVVAAAWGFAGLVGALPYQLTGTTAFFTDAVFESVSGFTTTGASIFVRFEGISHGIFLWRSLTHWFGGMGIIMLMLVILPALGVGGLQLYKREVPGPTTEKLTPRLRDTAKALWSIYVLLTGLETGLLYLAGMPLFDAVNNSMATLSTGGFSPNGNSIGGYGSLMIDWIVIAFMFLGGTSFALHYQFLRHGAGLAAYWWDTEWRWFTITLLIASLGISAHLYLVSGYGLVQALTQGTFQLVSILTCTGFGTDDYTQWGAAPQILLLLAMLAGGCVGSTSGGIKWLRITVIFKSIPIELLRLRHHRMVRPIKFRDAIVTPDLHHSIVAFTLLYLFTFAVFSLLLTADGNSIPTALGAVASAMANVGPGFDAVGPASNYFEMHALSKWALIFLMVAGRLELVTLYVLFMPSFWRF